MTEKSVQCSELGDVHLAQVHLQQKSIGGSEASVQMGVAFLTPSCYRTTDRMDNILEYQPNLMIEPRTT
ncbi:unnamed protein product, partial [Rotaria socialis]